MVAVVSAARRIVSGVVEHATQHRPSTLGNPAYSITLLLDGVGVETFRTSPNSACAYSVPNLLGVGLYRRPHVVLTLTAARRVVGLVAFDGGDGPRVGTCNPAR